MFVHRLSMPAGQGSCHYHRVVLLMPSDSLISALDLPHQM
jgi:hypothetical protein